MMAMLVSLAGPKFNKRVAAGWGVENLGQKSEINRQGEGGFRGEYGGGDGSIGGCPGGTVAQGRTTPIIEASVQKRKFAIGHPLRRHGWQPQRQ